MPLSKFPHRARRLAGFATCAALGSAAATQAVAAAGVSVELNRLEPRDASCRVSMVVNNTTDRALDSLKLDLVFFDKQGVIARRLAVEAGPLRASKTTVKLFEATDVVCPDLSRILLNDITACGAGGGDCLDLVGVSSRVKDVEFGK